MHSDLRFVACWAIYSCLLMLISVLLYCWAPPSVLPTLSVLFNSGSFEIDERARNQPGVGRPAVAPVQIRLVIVGSAVRGHDCDLADPAEEIRIRRGQLSMMMVYWKGRSLTASRHFFKSTREEHG